MDFQEALSAVKAGNATEEAIAILEKKFKDVDSAAVGHKARADKAEAEAQKAATLARLLSENGFDTDADLAEQFAKIKGIPAQKDDEISKLRAEHNRKFAELEAKEKAATEKARKKGAEAELIPELEKVFVKGSAIFKALSFDNMIKYDDDDRPFATIDGADYRGAELAAKLKEHPEYSGLAKNTQNAGGGSSGAGGRDPKTSQEDKMAFIRERNSKF